MNPAEAYVNASDAKCEARAEEPSVPASGVPISMMKIGERGVIVSISGKEEVRKFLTELGFTVGTEIKAVSIASGNVIVDVKGSRVAIDKTMANKIKFRPGCRPAQSRQTPRTPLRIFQPESRSDCWHIPRGEHGPAPARRFQQFLKFFQHPFEFFRHPREFFQHPLEFFRDG